MKRFIEGDDREQGALFPDHLEDFVSEDNPVRAVDAFVDALDLVGIGFNDAAATGRPGYHPAVLLKIYVYGYLNRIQSSRRLELETGRNVEMMWLSEGGRSRERSTGTADREGAEVFFAGWLQDRQRDSGPRDPAETLITDLLGNYAEERGPKMASPERICYAVMPLSEFFEGWCADKITEVACDAYKDWRGKADGTVRRELGTLRAALNHAYKHNRLTRQIPVILPEAPAPKGRWLTRKEAAALIRSARQSDKSKRHLSLFILTGLYTGKRKEAILSLRWSQVDLDRGVIDWDGGRRITKKRRGKNPVNPKLLAHLRRARLYGSDLGPVIAFNNKPVKDVKTAFQAAVVRAELEDVTPHTLRHTCATWLMQAGIRTWQAAGYLGMTEETLLRVYGHHHPEHQMEAAHAF